MADSEDSEPADSFGQRLPPLYIYLKRVLDKYPEGGQILKELVQNADDANARNVVFFYDKSEHPRQRLWSDALGDFQGPALYAYNDASFSKEDWENIQHPEQSGKRKDPTKVGRFGLGFISVFHLTDMPCILSERHIGYLDPLQKHFNYDPHTDTTYVGQRGKRWELSSELLEKFPDQFSLYLNDLFHCDETTFNNGRFKGTVFRFPLRKRPSKMSASLFDDEQRILELFDSFKTDAELSLLFLKNVESIAVYEGYQDCERPRLVFKVQIREEDRLPARESTLNFLRQIPQKGNFQTLSSVHIESQLGSQAAQSTNRYITINALRNDVSSTDLKELIKDEELNFLPWMGMSMPVSSTSEPGTDQHGRVFCFLPLPETEQTGLPLHVHGYFGVGDNRRSIKWPDQESQHDKKALWNQLLVREVFPEVYASLILAAIQTSQDPTDPMQPGDVYKGWPCRQSINDNWSDGVRSFLRLLQNEAIFFAESEQGGGWMKSSDVFINTNHNELISEVLKQMGVPVSEVPDHVVDTLRWADVSYKEVTPTVVRKCIRGNDLQFTSDEKLCLLEYVTSDGISDLDNLFLLPLQNGDFVGFCESAPKVFIATSENPCDLIPNAGKRFAAGSIPAILKEDPVVETSTQLKILRTADVAPLLLEMMPSSWGELSAATNALPWTPGVDDHPSLRWLELMWEWLTNHHMQLPLDTFKDIPLIPMPHGRIARLKINGLIFRKHQNKPDSESLSENICLFLESVGVIVVQHELPQQVSNHPHLKRFIRTPTPKGVMSVIEASSHSLSTLHIISCVASMTPDGKDELRAFLAQPNWEMTSQHQDILRKLPLFFTSSGQYASAEHCIAAVQEDYFQIPVHVLKDGSKYILHRDMSDNLALSLGIPPRSVREFLVENILPSVVARFYSAEMSLKIMAWVLERPEFDDLIRRREFIPTAAIDKQLSSPNHLFEPTDELQVLFGEKKVFPTGVYAEGKLLSFLKRVGLKKPSDVTSEEVLDSATEVSSTQESGSADVNRGVVLFDHISRNPHLLFEDISRMKLHKRLEDLYWVPCEAEPPSEYPVSAGWKGNSQTLYSPTEVGLIEAARMHGSVLPLIKLPDMKDDLLRAFSWSKTVDPFNRRHVELAVLQLKNISNNFNPTLDEPYAFSHSASEIYRFLSMASGEDVKEIFATHMKNSQPWVWHGSGFAAADKVALSIGTLGVSLVPYLHIVPNDVQKYNHFFAEMGVQQTFQENELCAVLRSVQLKNQTVRVPSRDDYQIDLNLVCNILRYIVNLDSFETQTSKILVPCRMLESGERRLNLEQATTCLYVDEERLAAQLNEEDTRKELDKPVIHEAVSNDLAQRLGLKPLSHFLAPVDEVEYDVTGPHETTVNAIKRNLEMYKNDVDIFKELIQNADDAGATEVKFLLDWRRNEETSHNLLSDGMKACHGPALWAYNDACFSKDDIKNICSIAAQSKKQQLDKVGRFGLGFTSVYHLTDVPSVVSGPYVLICDPRTIHLGSRVKPGQPGIKLDLTNERHRRTLKSYPNQFEPFNGIFGCKLNSSTERFDHTLFRLPLRTEFEADSQQPNQLSDFVCDSRDKIDPLLESLKKSLATLLLFTQNVVRVSVHELYEKDSEMKQVMSATASMYLQMPRVIASSPNQMHLRTQRGILKATAECIKESSLAVPETTMILKVTQEMCESDEFVNERQKTDDSYFIVSSCMTKGDILDLACTHEGRKAGVLPCGGVAAQLAVGKGGCLLAPDPVQGSAFSYLPLSLLTGLPFHVNGNFLLQPNRRQLWGKSSSGTEEFEARWNSCFIESVLLRALLNLLLDLQALQEQDTVDARNFQSLWPRRNECESNFYPLVDAYYRMIGRANHAPSVIFSQSRWVSVHECFFTHWQPTDPISLRDSVKTLLAKHQHPKTWVELDPDVVSSISQAGANERFDVNTFTVERFLQDVFFPTLAQCRHIESKHQDEIVLHVLDLRLGERKVVDYDEDLKRTKCISASPRGDKFDSPGRLINPCTPLGSLYSEGDGRFPHGSEYRKDARLLSLTQLGMASFDLSWEDICERTESMLQGGQFDQRGATLLKVIDEKLAKYGQPTVEQERRIQKATFLPVLKKPDSYPVQWYPCETDLMSAETLWESSHLDLLGSIRPLLDEERLGSDALSQRVKTLLGIQGRCVAVTDVVEQLKVLINGASGVLQRTSSILYSIYAFLQKEVCGLYTFSRPSVNTKHSASVAQLCKLRFILCEGEFRECKHLALNYSRSGPYLFRVPQTLSYQYRALLQICGVRDNFEVNDYLETLQVLKEKYQDEALSAADLPTAVAMMADIDSLSKGDPSKTQDILTGASVFLPDHCGIMRSPNELTFNDVDWEGSWGDNLYTHPDIPYPHAKLFGIITQRDRQLGTCSSSSGFEMDFGQQEKLTDRLSGILRSYPNVSDVFKELLQNADDAGATEIHFVYDPRSHPEKKIIADSWKSLQRSPSLCVFNDTPFTEADIEGIQKVGIGGKRDDIATTGKFGIGFNSVYHLTDCPSFLSNSDTLCVFDPLLKYVPGTRENSRPGKRFETGAPFRQSYPDMLRGYLEDVGDFQGRVGTMFRFPLRTLPSVISREVFQPSDMQRLLDGFQDVSKDALLFLNNIKKITISNMDKQTGALKKRYSISATLTEEDEQQRVLLTEHLKLFNDNPCEKVPNMSCVYNLVTKDSEGTEQTWLISQMLGFEDLADGESVSSAAYLKKPLPRGGVAALVGDNRMDGRYKAYCCLPLPIYTELPVHVNGTFELGAARKNLQKGDAYGTSRTEYGLIHRWNQLLVEHVIAPAYAKMFKPAGRMLVGKTKVSSAFKDHLRLYENLFPKDLKAVHGEWLLLAKATLRYVAKNNLRVLPVVRHQRQISWHHPGSLVYFDTLDLEDESDEMGGGARSNTPPPSPSPPPPPPLPPPSGVDVLRSFLLEIGFKLLASSPKLCSAFQECGVDAKFVSPEAVVQFLLSETVITPALPALLKKTAFGNFKTFFELFEYCLKGITRPSQLLKLPLRLANDNTLSQFTPEGCLYLTSHWTVLPGLSEMFLHKALEPPCTKWLEKNKTSMEAFTSGVFKRFTLAELGQHLGDHLPKEWQNCNRHVEWKPQKKRHPSKAWQRNLWKFICSETSELENPDLSLEAIGGWPIFPTTSGEVAPPSLSKTVLFLQVLGEQGFGSSIAETLRKLGLPEIAWNKMRHPNAARPPMSLLLEHHLALPTSHNDVIRVIQFMLETTSVINNLSDTDCRTLLHYFQEGFVRKTLTIQGIQTIRKLPIFKLQGVNENTNIQRSQLYHSVEGFKILMLEADTWMKNKNCVFLEARPTFNLIYQELGISPIRHAGIYLNYILPSFSLLSQDARIKHVINIKDILLRSFYFSEEDQKAILDRLTHTPFILDQSNVLRQADYFFDPSNPLFKALIPAEKLLPCSMSSLKDFLDSIGLHTEVDQNDFITFAKRVEARASQMENKNQLKNLCDISKLLKKELDCNEELHDRSFLWTISSIKFVPSVAMKPELEKVCPPFVSPGSNNPHGVPFTAYRGSVAWNYLELVWTVSMVLPRWAMPDNIEIRQGVNVVKVRDCLGIVTEESEITQKVLEHTRLVCERMKKFNVVDKKDTLPKKVRETVKSVMDKILKHLRDSPDRKRIRPVLMKTPICPVENGCVFVRADQLVFQLSDDYPESGFRPYLYTVPTELYEFREVLKLLGTQDRCSFDQLAGVLSAVKDECAEKRIDEIPKELSTVKCAVTGIFKLLRTKKEKCEISIPKLYLPSSKYILREAPELYYADSNQIDLLKVTSNREFVLPLRACDFHCRNEKVLIGYLPSQLRPKYLDDELHEKPCTSNRDCSNGEECQYLAHLKLIVNSADMTQALLRLYQHQLKDQELPEDDIKRIGALQTFSRLFCKAKLKIGFYDNDGKKIAEQQHPSKAFFDQDTSSMFVAHTWPLTLHLSQTYAEIAKCCNDLLGGILDDKHVNVLQNALDCSSPDDMDEILTLLKIPHYDDERFLTQTHRPGEIVPLDIRHFLDDDPFNLFFKDDIVGYIRNVQDGYSSAGKRKRRSSKRSSDRAALVVNETTEVIYAVIVDQIGKGGESSDLSKRYRIDIGEQENITVSVTALFKFLRPKEENEMASVDGSLPEDPQRDREQIEREVRAAFALPVEEQKRVIHRLYRKWHPDKNPDQQKRTNEAFAFLKQEINKQGGSDRYSQHYSHWEAEVNKDMEEARWYRNKYNRSRNRKRGRSSGGIPFSFSRETPDPRSARLWFRQAKEHFNSAKQTSQLPQAPGQWIAFQVHQAAEVALKAAQYNLTGRPNTRSNDLSGLASSVCQHRYVTSYKLSEVAGNLERRDCLYDKPRYPHSSQTSTQIYGGFSAEEALNLCEELLNLVRDIIGIKEF